MSKVKGKRWTEADDETVARMCEEGASAKQMAEALGFTRQHIGMKLSTLGLTAKRKHVEFSQREIDRVRELHAQGLSDMAIAKTMGRSVGGVHRFRVMMRLKTNHRGGVAVPPVVSNKYTIHQLMAPTKFRPGTPEREDIERQRKINGIANHVLDAE